MRINKEILKLLTFFLIPLLSVSLLTACSDDENGAIVDPPQEDDPNIVELIQEDDRFSFLAQIIADLELSDALTESGITVFAPTNAAFDAIGDAVPSLTDEEIEQIVTYHLVDDVIASGDLDASTDVVTQQGERALVQASAAGVLINGFANVVEADIEATNGIIHAIDQVLLPTEFRVALQGPSLVEVAQEAGMFNELLAFVDLVGLTTTLQFLGPYTAFAPTDEAFERLFEQIPPENISPEALAGILTYHVILGEVPSSALEPTQTVPSAAEELLYIVANEDGVVVNGRANVIQPDVDEAVNGIIHVVDEVLLLNAFLTIPGLIQKNFELTTLLGLAAERPDIVEALSDPAGEFTVFAPNNEAFAAALEAYPDLTDDEITEILTYHVLTSAVLSSDLEDGSEIETLLGENITVTIDGEDVQINESNVVTVNIVGANGVVHIIDEVLLPPNFRD